MNSEYKENIASLVDENIREAPVPYPSNLLEVLDGISYPASKMDLITYAEDKGASEEILDQLQAMPDDIYNGIKDITIHANDIEIIEGSENLWSSEESHDLPDEAERYVSDMNGIGRV